MEQYIPKSALVAEIERIENAWKKHCFPNPKGSAEECLECLAVYNIKTLNFIKDFLDTLEVKEVDFEKIWKEYFKYKGDVATVNIKHLAKHFFELGMRQSKNYNNNEE